MNTGLARLISLGNIWQQETPQEPCAGRNYPRGGKHSFGLHFANFHCAESTQNTQGCAGKGVPRNYFSPHTDPSVVTALRCTGCFVVFVRVLQNSLEIAPSSRYSASRTPWCQCSEAVRAEPRLGALCCCSITVRCQDPQGTSRQLLPNSHFAQNVLEQRTWNPWYLGFAPVRGWSRAAHGDSGMGSVLEPGRISSLEPSPGGKGSSAAWRATEGQAGWTRPPAPGIWGCHGRLEGPGQAAKRKTGVFGKGNPSSCSSRASG